MPTLTIEYQTDAERLILEQALALVAQTRAVGATAPDGAVLAACERVALDPGRPLVRDALASAVQGRTDATDASRRSPARGSKGGAAAG